MLWTLNLNIGLLIRFSWLWSTVQSPTGSWLPLHIWEIELELMLFNFFINNLNNGIEVYAQEVHKHYQIGGSSWHAGGQNRYSEKPQQTVEIVYQEHQQW